MNTRSHYRVVFKFNHSIELPEEEKEVEEYLSKDNPALWQRLLQLYPVVRIKRVFFSVKPGEIKKKLQEAKQKASDKGRDYDPPAINNYFAIKCPYEIDKKEVIKILQQFDCVELAYIEAALAEPPSVNASNNPRSAEQHYLDPAPVGIDARFAWTKDGGDGNTGSYGNGKVQFIDIEQGWNLNHKDLAAAGISLLPGGINLQYKWHGTSVLGIILAQDNNIGCVGITPFVSAKVSSIWRIDPEPSDSGNGAIKNIADAIWEAIHALKAGDVILIEAQLTDQDELTKNLLPVELEPAIFDAITVGTNLDIIIVEAGGNKRFDLDDFRNESEKFVLKKDHPDFKDSGAIMVGAAVSTVPHRRKRGKFGSNYGSRIDCFAWGSDINTTSSDKVDGNRSLYTSAFSETSGASAIIAGAVISIQSMKKQADGRKYDPDEIRRILHDPECGTASSNPETDKIGLMPDLKKIFKKYIEGGVQP
ncbi:MAG: S8 family peptidase [Chitinophagaceae bacterium]